MDVQFTQKVEEEYVKRDTDVKPGDTVKVHLRITEAGKERVQVFEGVVISVKGSGLSKMITVRKISYGVGVEKILPVNSPMIKKIDVVSRGKVRRSKLYYMRKKIGKRSLDAGLDEQFEAIMEEEEAEQADEAEKKEEKEEGTSGESEGAEPEKKDEATGDVTPDTDKEEKGEEESRKKEGSDEKKADKEDSKEEEAKS